MFILLLLLFYQFIVKVSYLIVTELVYYTLCIMGLTICSHTALRG